VYLEAAVLPLRLVPLHYVHAEQAIRDELSLRMEAAAVSAPFSTVMRRIRI